MGMDSNSYSSDESLSNNSSEWCIQQNAVNSSFDDSSSSTMLATITLKEPQKKQEFMQQHDHEEAAVVSPDSRGDGDDDSDYSSSSDSVSDDSSSDDDSSCSGSSWSSGSSCSDSCSDDGDDDDDGSLNDNEPCYASDDSSEGAVFEYLEESYSEYSSGEEDGHTETENTNEEEEACYEYSHKNVLRAYEGYKRLSKPSLKEFLTAIEAMPGLNITETDIARLPWNSRKTHVVEGIMEEAVYEAEARIQASNDNHEYSDEYDDNDMSYTSSSGEGHASFDASGDCSVDTASVTMSDSTAATTTDAALVEAVGKTQRNKQRNDELDQFLLAESRVHSTITPTAEEEEHHQRLDDFCESNNSFVDVITDTADADKTTIIKSNEDNNYDDVEQSQQPPLENKGGEHIIELEETAIKKGCGDPEEEPTLSIKKWAPTLSPTGKKSWAKKVPKYKPRSKREKQPKETKGEDAPAKSKTKGILKKKTRDSPKGPIRRQVRQKSVTFNGEESTVPPVTTSSPKEKQTKSKPKPTASKKVKLKKHKESVEERSPPLDDPAANNVDELRPEVLRHQRRLSERALRLKRMKDRIKKEKEEEEIRKREEEAKKKTAGFEAANIDRSEKARRLRAYEWYNRCGMPPRDNLKERVAKMGRASGVTQSDIDLLPWNKSGRRVDLKVMLNYRE